MKRLVAAAWLAAYPVSSTGAQTAPPYPAITIPLDYIQYVRGAMAAAVQNWTDFDVAYREADWSKYREFPAFASNNRGNA